MINIETSAFIYLY